MIANLRGVHLRGDKKFFSHPLPPKIALKAIK